MGKYINADLLRAEIESRKDAILSCPVNGIVTLEVKSAIQSMAKGLLSFLDSLQQEQPTIEEDWVEKRKQECMCRRLSANGNYQCERYEGVFGPCDGRCSWIVDYPKLKKLKERKPEVDLEKFTEMIDDWKARFNRPDNIPIKATMAFTARMFYMYPNVARQWYERLPKATMDNTRNEE